MDMPLIAYILSLILLSGPLRLELEGSRQPSVVPPSTFVPGRVGATAGSFPLFGILLHRVQADVGGFFKPKGADMVPFVPTCGRTETGI